MLRALPGARLITSVYEPSQDRHRLLAHAEHYSVDAFTSTLHGIAEQVAPYAAVGALE
jgi:hypothetical protein